MITLRRAKERHHIRRRKQEVWCTFSPEDREDPLADGFGALQSLNEERLPKGAGIPLKPCHDAEIITYVHEGSLAYEDSTGRSGVIHAGEFQRIPAGRRIRHSTTNASRTDSAHFFQIWLRLSQLGLDPSHEQKRFSVAERKGVLCVIASPDGRRGSLRTHQGAVIYSAVLDPGQHLIHEFSPQRSAWLHVVRGDATLGDVVLTTGDGAGVTAERAISLTARAEAEVLLLDICEQPPRSPNDGVVR